MQAELVIKTVSYFRNWRSHYDVAVQGGKIVAIGQDLSGERVIDATGLVVSPGWWMLMFILPILVVVTAMNGRVCHRNGRLCQRGVTTFMEMPLNQIPATVDKTS